MERFGLRLRVFLFFGLLAGGAIAIAAGGMALGWSRADPPLPAAPFVTGFITFAMLNTLLVVGIWLLFDENVAKPINQLSANLRMRAHADVDDTLDADAAQYLGDLAPAAAALSEKASSTLEDTAAQITRETERLGLEHSRLAALLTESPIATMLLNPAKEIVLYDGQAAGILSQISVPRLRAPISDYFESEGLEAAMDALKESGTDVQFTLVAKSQTSEFSAKIKALGDDGHMIFIDPPDAAAEDIEQRPLVFDFDLMTSANTGNIQDCALSDLCFVVLDLETTGLSVESDAIVQIGAVRVLNNALVPGEELSTYVNPGRPIPPASTRIHHVSDDHVKDAPDIATAGKTLHDFSRDAVLVAHNAPFDMGLLKRDAPKFGEVWDHPILDTVLLSAVVFGTTEQHSLDALCERLSIEILPKDRHTALGDARVTAKALMALLGIAESRGLKTFGDLQPELDRQAKRLYSAA